MNESTANPLIIGTDHSRRFLFGGEMVRTYLYTNNYGAFRTYHMTRSHIICYRMHRKVMTADERLYLWREIIFWKLIRILLAEPEKLTRLKAFVRGILNGIAYKITDTCPHPKQ